jgi:rod shape-determining protein MreC
MYYDGGRRKSIYLWIVVLVLIIAVLNTPSIRRFKLIRAARIISNNIIFPFKYAGTAIYHGVTSGVGNIIGLRGVQKENEGIKSEISDLKARNLLLEQLGRDNQKLREMLGFRSGYYGSRLLPAEIIGRSGSNWFEVIEMNRGAGDNLSTDTAVINEEGLVGRVFEVSKFSSKVLLITDPSSAVSVIDAVTGDMGILSGNSIGPLTIKYMSASASVKAGDKIITSGMSDIFPKGILVGVVKSVSKKDYDVFQKVEVSPAVNFSRLDKIFAVVK